MVIKIKKASAGFEREPLKAPFGFKGGYVTGTWQTAVFLESESGKQSTGLGLQSVLWSDAQVFAKLKEAGGNAAMFLITQYAAGLLEGRSFENPIDLQEQILEQVYQYGQLITQNKELKKTFVLNALVPVDLAAWQLYAYENGFTSFDQMIPFNLLENMEIRNEKLAAIPLITYGMSLQEVEQEVDNGAFFLKIKIGCDPEGDGDLEKMLQWDCERLAQLHNLLKNKRIPYTENNMIPYYLDANGRYDSVERVERLLAYAKEIGALEHIILLEEPFPEGAGIRVSDLPVRVAADESAHSDQDVKELISLGYTAIALKPIAKTLSMTMKILRLALENDICCFCADLTVNPFMVEWNKNVAARIPNIPGMHIGVLESNGHQNYVNWERMKTYHPCFGESFINPKDGIYLLNEQFYSSSGGIFMESSHYRNLACGINE